MTVYYGKNKNNIILILRPNWKVHSQHYAVHLQKKKKINRLNTVVVCILWMLCIVDVYLKV